METNWSLRHNRPSKNFNRCIKSCLVTKVSHLVVEDCASIGKGHGNKILQFDTVVNKSIINHFFFLQPKTTYCPLFLLDSL